ncbi:A-kinase anchor protein 5 [Psammomys obesus]|uniref:A-kinase anchor protein 5 n=1 Tax=Psammomys obesus TaxID=48139 RepID=UPI0024536AB9|nr:A-kinase anchor protein 5 [Psammomys obesus]XP_055475253.1 A-kinase anchor protein 5 [Psammomys obesus]XP_055475254.1 A-kinase anchor protein 5 [Psammomys obesus]
MEECSVKAGETVASEIQVETKGEKGPVAVSPQEERQERKTATLCFKRRKKANKMKPKADSKTVEVTKKRPPEAGDSGQSQPAGAWASLKRLVTHRKRSGSSKKLKLSEPEEPEDVALPKKKAKSRLKIPCIRFSKGAKRSRHSKLTEDSGYVRVQGEADDLETKAQTQLADQAIQAKSTQEGVLAEAGKEIRESHVSNSVTSGENVISVQLELENESSAIQMGTPGLETETKVIKETQHVQAQRASSEAGSPRPVASAAPPSPATAHRCSVGEPSEDTQESAKDERSRKSAAEEKKSGGIVLSQAEETAVSRAEEATVGQAEEATVGQAEETTVGQIREVTVGQVEKTSVGQAMKITVSQAEAATVGQAEAATVAQAEEATVGQAEAATVAQAEAATVAQAEAATVAQAEEATVGQAEAATVAKAEAATVPQAEEATVGQAEAATVAKAEAATVGQAEAATVTQAEEATVGQAEEATVAQAEEATVAQAEAGTVGQAEEAIVSQAEEETVAQTEEDTVQTEEATVGQEEEDIMAQAEAATVSQAEKYTVQAEEDTGAQAEEDTEQTEEDTVQAEEATVGQAEEDTLQAEEAAISRGPDLKENGLDTEKPRSEESKRMEPIAIIITDTEISEFDVKKSKNVPKQFLISMESEQVGVFANDSDFEGRTSEQYETLLIETASSLVKNAIELSVEQLVNEMVSEDDKINTLLQ